LYKKNEIKILYGVVNTILIIMAKLSKVAIEHKGYEQKYSSKLNSDEPWIIRLDGHKFSTFTRGFKKPFDERIYRAMIRTTADLVKYFHASSGYTESDEISIVFPSLASLPPLKNSKNERKIIFGGRVEKLISLAASYASVRFNYHLNREKFETNSVLQEKVENCVAHFDGRIFHLPSNIKCLQNIYWRRKDSVRNSKTSFGRHFFSEKKLHGLNSDQIIELVLSEKGEKWENLSGAFKWGTVIKKQYYEKICFNQKLNKEQTILRTQMALMACDPELWRHSNEFANFLVQSKATDEHALGKHFIPII